MTMQRRPCSTARALPLLVMLLSAAPTGVSGDDTIRHKTAAFPADDRRHTRSAAVERRDDKAFGHALPMVQRR